MKSGKGRNRRQSAAILAARVEVSNKRILTDRAFTEAVKDNLADKVIDNFVGELVNKEWSKRFAFALGILRGVDENPAQAVEDLAQAIHPAKGGLVWEHCTEGDRQASRNDAADLYRAAGIEI